jgi:uncharacterized protein involved in response to NO
MTPLKQLFAFPFRIFFASAAAWAVLSVLLWALQMNGVISLPLAHAPLIWHRHEMLFGFLNPAIAGFLLTAVCVWTGTERLHGAPLALLWVVWLGGRLTAAFGGEGLAGWSIAINLAFLPLIAVDAGRRILGARQWRHLVLLVILTLLWLMELGSLLRQLTAFTNGALVLAAALMLVVGGRITPTFSAAWLRLHGGDPERVRTLPPLELAVTASLLFLLVAVLLDHGAAVAVLAVVTAALTLARLGLWRGWLVRSEPLLWILHLSLLWIPVALLLLAGHHGLGWPATGWQHALGIGAIGGLILGVMTRVALGHTGRPLQLPSGMVTAYALIQLTALLRLLTVFAVIPWQWGIAASAAAWTAAFLLFLWRYLPVLWRPRVDGKPG